MQNVLRICQIIKREKERNGMSRSDGYWAYIREGQEPPQSLTYGEFDIFFFAELLDRAHYHYYSYPGNANNEQSTEGWEGKHFLDLGSGTGRLVIGAAALHPDMAACSGLELLPRIHDKAVESLAGCTTYQSHKVSMSPVQFTCGSFDDPYEFIGNSDVIFVFSTCMNEIMGNISADDTGAKKTIPPTKINTP